MEESNQNTYSIPLSRQDGPRVMMEIKQKHQFTKKRKVKTWTAEEDKQLILLYHEYPKNWTVISSMMYDRNQNQCLHRYRRIINMGVNKKVWLPQQDEAIKKLVKKVGKNWKILAQMIGTKTGKQIRQRFINKLDPKIKNQDWTDQQDKKIIYLYSQIGKKWSQISKQIPGRPQNKIKNRFYSFILKNYDIKIKPYIKQQEEEKSQQFKGQLSSKSFSQNKQFMQSEQKLLNDQTNYIQPPEVTIQHSDRRPQQNPILTSLNKIEDYSSQYDFNSCNNLKSIFKIENSYFSKQKFDNIYFNDEQDEFMLFHQY